MRARRVPRRFSAPSRELRLCARRVSRRFSEIRHGLLGWGFKPLRLVNSSFYIGGCLTQRRTLNHLTHLLPLDRCPQLEALPRILHH